MSDDFPGLISFHTLRVTLKKHVEVWLKRNELNDGSPDEVCRLFLDARIRDVSSISSSLGYIESAEEGSWVEGFVLGYLASNTKLALDTANLKEKFADLTNSYYFFNPHSAFRYFRDTGSFVESFTDFATKSFAYQHDFALDRLGYGQNPKFLSISHRDLDTIEFLADSELIAEKAGLIDFLEGTLRFWISARLLSIGESGRVEILATNH